MPGGTLLLEIEGEVGGGRHFLCPHATGDIQPGPAFDKKQLLPDGVIADNDGGVERGLSVGP